MPNLTVAISENLKKELDQLPEVNWSEAVRSFLSDKVKRASLLKRLDKMLENSELTEDDCIKLGRKAKKSMHRKFSKEVA